MISGTIEGHTLGIDIVDIRAQNILHMSHREISLPTVGSADHNDYSIGPYYINQVLSRHSADYS